MQIVCSESRAGSQSGSNVIFSNEAVCHSQQVNITRDDAPISLLFGVIREIAIFIIISVFLELPFSFNINTINCVTKVRHITSC